MINDYYIHLRNELSIIDDLLNDGYSLKSITINNISYGGKTIKHFDITNIIWIEFYSGRILIAPLYNLTEISLTREDDK